MSLVSHVCIHPWAAEGVEGGLRLHIGERVILQRSEGDWGMVNKQDSPKVGAMVRIYMASFLTHICGTTNLEKDNW